MKKMSDEEFIRIWQKAETRQEVAEICETSGPSVGVRAQNLKRMGVKLKNFARGRKKKVFDVEHLNAIAEER